MLTVAVSQRGAELCGVRADDGIEYLWQGDPTVWGRHAPLLFPIVGKLAGDRYTWNNKAYELNQHGFVRDLNFTLVAHSDTSLSYELKASPKTLAQYPFEFTLMRHYRLAGASLEVVTEVTNRGHYTMPYSIGEHPGFALDWGAGDAVEDYYLEFEKNETLDTVRLDEQHLLSSRTERVLTDARVLPLHRHLFDQDALIFMKLKSTAVSVCSKRHHQRVKVSFPGYPQLGIWAKPGAPFVCIEPWYGYADTSDHNGCMMKKPGIHHLAPGATFTCAWQVEIIP